VAPVKTLTRVSRRDRAHQTRVRILEAAYRLFCKRGWEGTTMQLVADEADVAVQTVYFGFGTKARLLAAVEEHTILGGAPRPAFFERWAAASATETDPLALIRRFVEIDSRIKARLAPLVAGMGGSMPAESGRDRESGRDQFFGQLVDRLQALRALKGGLSRDRALDLLRVLNDQASFSDLTMRRGWTQKEWIEWMSALLASQLLKGGA